jgi:hypothetical protein
MKTPRIDKNIPLPKRFPFDRMEVGDSFAVPPDVKRSTISVAAKRFGVESGWKFTVRQMPNRSLRCWRVA